MMPENAVVLVKQPHGGALRVGGPGRKPSRAEIARREAGGDLMKCLHKLQAIRDDPDASADDVVKACQAIWRMSGADREKPAQERRCTFSVVHRSPEEMMAIAEHQDGAGPAAAPPRAPTP